MIKNMLFLLFCSIEAVVMQRMFFSGDLVVLGDMILLLMSFCFWGAIMTLPRWIMACTLTVQWLVNSLLLIWHSHFENPFSVMMGILQYKEGLEFVKNSKLQILEPELLVALFFFIVQLWLLKGVTIQKDWRWRSIFYVPLLALFGITFKTFNNQPFLQMDFNAYTKTLGYMQGWIYEGMTSYDRKRIAKETLDNINLPTLPLPEELAKVTLPDNVYLIQIESLDYAAFTGKVNDRRIMPFLQSIAPQSAVYQVKPLSHYCSANADFSLMSKLTNNEDLFAAMYMVLPNSFFKKFVSLPEKFNKLGYHTSFFHGYIRNFYRRGDAYQNFPFSEVFFLEDMPKELNQGEMGIDDEDVVDFMLAQNKKVKALKKFNFFITLSSHVYYQIGEKNRYPFENPKNIEEKYVNSINYVDKALQKLIEQSPKDSLFIIYSDHPSGTSFLFSEEGKKLGLGQRTNETLLLIYDKNKNLAHEGKILFPQITSFVHGIVEQSAR